MGMTIGIEAQQMQKVHDVIGLHSSSQRSIVLGCFEQRIDVLEHPLIQLPRICSEIGREVSDMHRMPMDDGSRLIIEIPHLQQSPRTTSRT